MTPEQSAAVERLRQALARHDESTDKFERAAWHQAAMMLCTPNTIRHLLAALDEAQQDAARFRWLRERDLDSINAGGLFVGRTPDNVVINGDDLDAAIDAARASAGGAA